MKKYNLTVFFSSTGFCKTITHVLEESRDKCLPLGSSFSEKQIPEDSLSNIIVLELKEKHKSQLKQILEIIEGYENSICIIAEPENESLYQYSRNAHFFENIIKMPVSAKEFGIMLELSKERQEKKVLRKKSQLFSAAVNQSANTIVITDPEGKIEFVNPAFEEKTGYTFKEVYGEHTRILKSGEHETEVYEKMWKIIKMGVKWEGELLNKKKNGELFWEEVTISPIMDESGTILNFLAVKNDISERKKSGEALLSSKKLLREIMDHVPQFVYVRDLQNRYHHVNKAFADYLGKHPRDIKGKTETELDSPRTAMENSIHEDKLVIEQGKEIHREEKFFDPIENRERYFQYSKVPIKLPATGDAAVLSVWNCVTDQKAIEMKLRDAGDKLLDAQKLAGFGNWSVDFENETAQWTDQMFEQYGLDPSQGAPYGKDFYNYIHPDDREQVLSAIETARSEGYAKYECRAIKPDDEITYIEATVKPIKKDGKVTGFFGTSLDISSRKNYEEEIIAARKEAIAAAKAKSDFLSVMSHEIRTPLNAIIVMADMLINEAEDPALKENLEILGFSARDLLSIVNDILDYSKIEAGKLELESIPINTHDYLNKILNTNLLRAQEKGIKLELDFDENIPQVIMGDPLRLGQVLKNLISNAVKFTEKGGVKLIVRQQNRDHDSCKLYFGVKDTGIGIHADKIESLFEVFTQASSETSRKYGGTGLGLAIVKSLLFMHNSRIAVESKPDEGSLFSFEIDFPYRQDEAQKKEEIPERLDSLSLEGYNIMLVEDNVMNIMVAKKIFDKWKCKLHIAEDGYIAMQMATRHDFDLILMDLQMPGIDGFETTRKLRKLSDYYSRVPIFALSAAAPGEVKDTVKEAGMDELICKPFNPKELYRLIKSYLPEPAEIKHTAPAIVSDRQPKPDEGDINIEILVKLSTLLHKEKANKAISYMENVAKDKSQELESSGLIEIIETINSIIRINKSYIDNKNILIREMMSDLKKSLDEIKDKYESKS